MVDVETGELFVSERAMAGSIGSMSVGVKDMANNLIRDYLEGSAEPQASATENQPLVVETVLD
jgi:hypothetical protein